ncbi:uncharacterized protein TRAVEDRAFT_47555 [Trametes versicolor FP-101664 SS1]|uniref:uncharacterized protein n=1 Tax=Trametes versicolor (strain FP-101664) TaxID=717944 RepID=UPI0004621495|nr:uncharacterized protein TRAVEDRAFT_47555 [Trametes versicolor FP-101664 SS1]EIW58402.1 hypothetical protein TRAVEDRAFT_47555 [Trametes versicolor FP-101664 SS1]
MPLRVVIAHFHSGIGPYGVRPYQWHLCIETGHDRHGFVEATTFYIRGSSAGGFRYEWRERVRYKKLEQYRGSVCIGMISSRRYLDAVALMEEVRTADGSERATQSWAYAAARKLSAHGLMGELCALEFIWDQLQRGERAWERGDD